MRQMKPLMVQHYLDAPTLQTPDKVAITDGSREIRYRELSAWSGRLARCLRASGVGHQDRVALILQRAPGSLVAMLGVLKAGAVYVPVDSKAPVERWKQILDDASPSLVLCDSRTLLPAREAMAQAGCAAPVVALCRAGELGEPPPSGVIFWEEDCACEEWPPDDHLEETDLAYILYTSGSTGRPKGVMISHRNIRDYIDWGVDCFKITGSDVLLGTAPFHFDMSTFDLYCTLKAGATLCIAGEMLTLFPEKLVTFIEQQKVTLWKGVSSLLMYMARTGVLTPGGMPTLKQVLFAGEPLPAKYLIDWMRIFPEKRFCNAYGPTEATGVSLYYRVEQVPKSPGEAIPIGRPCTGKTVFLLSENNQPVAPGEVGELCIGGAGVARGYLNDLEKTARSFIEPPPGDTCRRFYKTGDLARLLPCGNYDYVGRKDRQLKYMGYRIEAGEVERTLLSFDGVRDAVVDLVETGAGEGVMELVAYLEVEAGIETGTVIENLKTRLPSYMVPRRAIRTGKMPRCSRGKVDLFALRLCTHSNV